ncbi:MAG: hypothetical protein M3020_15285 [Myxococcota bacterium]|nr:hypothetical protein [Myxococcota bacterium]
MRIPDSPMKLMVELSKAGQSPETGGMTGSDADDEDGGGASPDCEEPPLIEGASPRLAPPVCAAPPVGAPPELAEYRPPEPGLTLIPVPPLLGVLAMPPLLVALPKFPTLPIPVLVLPPPAEDTLPSQLTPSPQAA